MIEKTIDIVRTTDVEIAQILDKELNRQRQNIELIASENTISEQVMAAMGNHLSNKYAEGYPGRRYYGGCEYVDEVENIAIERVNKLFGSNYANVQPHSGAQANMAVYFGLLEPGDKVMGMNLAHGGHLTHGSSVNFSGKLYDFVQYNVGDESGYIDYDVLRESAIKEKPKMIVAGASAYSREIKFDIFADIAKEVGAYLFVDMAHIAGLVAAGQHMSPIPYADVVTTTTHKTLRGPRGGVILCKDAEFGKKFNKAVFPGIQGGPLMHVIAAKAVSFKEALEPSFVDYQKQVVSNAKALAQALISHDFRLVSGGTDNHMMLIDLRNKDISGKDLQHNLDEVRITTNKNTIPNETRSPFITSGIRVGTPTVTSRGMKEEDMKTIAKYIDLAVQDFEGYKADILSGVDELVNKYPLY